MQSRPRCHHFCALFVFSTRCKELRVRITVLICGSAKVPTFDRLHNRLIGLDLAGSNPRAATQPKRRRTQSRRCRFGLVNR